MSPCAIKVLNFFIDTLSKESAVLALELNLDFILLKKFNDDTHKVVLHSVQSCDEINIF